MFCFLQLRHCNYYIQLWTPPKCGLFREERHHGGKIDLLCCLRLIYQGIPVQKKMHKYGRSFCLSLLKHPIWTSCLDRAFTSARIDVLPNLGVLSSMISPGVQWSAKLSNSCSTEPSYSFSTIIVEAMKKHQDFTVAAYGTMSEFPPDQLMSSIYMPNKIWMLDSILYSPYYCVVLLARTPTHPSQWMSYLLSLNHRIFWSGDVP